MRRIQKPINPASPLPEPRSDRVLGEGGVAYPHGGEALGVKSRFPPTRRFPVGLPFGPHRGFRFAFAPLVASGLGEPFSGSGVAFPGALRPGHSAILLPSTVVENIAVIIGNRARRCQMPQHPEIRRLTRLATGMNKRARMALAPGTITAGQLLMIELSQMSCYYCGVALAVGGGQFDHKVALDKGGRNTFVNVVRCCTICNRRKFTKSPAEYAEHRERVVVCEVCGTEFQPRFAEYRRGNARICSRRCSALKRWHGASSSPATRRPSTTPTGTTTEE